MTNTDKHIPKHDKDMTSEWEDKFDRRFAGYSFLKEDGYIEFDGLRKETVRNFIESLLSQQREQILNEVRGEIELLKKKHTDNKSLLDCVDRNCRQNHARISSYNQAISDALSKCQAKK